MTCGFCGKETGNCIVFVDKDKKQTPLCPDCYPDGIKRLFEAVGLKHD